jgi:hypothetical protein
MPLTDRIILEVGWVGDRDLLVKEVDRAARTGSVVIFAKGRNEGKVTRVLGKEGEEGDDGWIDHVRSSFPEGTSEAEPFRLYRARMRFLFPEKFQAISTSSQRKMDTRILRCLRR